MISFFMVDRKSDLLLECDFVSLFLVEFFVHECIEIKQSCYQLSVFLKKMAKEKRKKTAKTKTWMLWFPTLRHCSSHKICETVRVLLKTVHTS